MTQEQYSKKYPYCLVFIPYDGLAFTSQEQYTWEEAKAVRKGWMVKASSSERCYIALADDNAIEAADNEQRA